MSSLDKFPGIKALTFDVFGTVVDWRSSIIAEGKALEAKTGIGADWAVVADHWRACYTPYMDKVRNGELPWTNLDTLHRMILDEIVIKFDLQGLSEEEIAEFNLAWHRLNPWPDAIQGLERIRKSSTIAALSNGNVSLLVDMAKHVGLPWDSIISAEVARHYKPDAIVYEKAAQLLRLKPAQVMMVATHVIDLEAAAGVGFKTAFVHRPFEYGKERRVSEFKLERFDLVAENFPELASLIGA